MLHVIKINHAGHYFINYLDEVKKDLIEWNLRKLWSN